MSEFKRKLEEARQRLPLRRLMEQRGKSPENGNWKSFKCPYCGKKSAGLSEGKRGDIFKCFNTGCPSGTAAEKSAWDEVGFLAHELSLKNEEAAIAFMKEAGVWRDQERLAPSVMPGKRGRRLPPPQRDNLPSPESDSSAPRPTSEEAESSLRAVLGSSSSSVGSPNQDEGTAVPDGPPGVDPVTAPLAVPPDPHSSGAAPLPPAGNQPSAEDPETTRPEVTPAATLSAEDQALIEQCVNIIRNEQKASVSLLQRRLSLGYARAARLMDELERRGIVGPAKGAEPRDILGEGSASQPSGGDELIDKWIRYLLLSEKRIITFLDLEIAEGFSKAKWLETELEKRGALGPANKAGERKVLRAKILPSVMNHQSVVPPAGEQGAPPAPPEPPTQPPTEEMVPPPIAALRWFYTRLHLSEADRETLWRVRGLHAATVEALGYRSNPRENLTILQDMEQHFPVAVLVDCGLWSEGKKATAKPKPNPQYHGMSLREKRDERGKKARNADGEPIVECVWDYPILIPYFDEAGELVHLRPHKGMMKDKPPRFYPVRTSRAWRESATDPRLVPVEGMKQFAVIGEGEFKAAALWQTIGSVAACGSVPGITMAKLLFGDMEEWAEELGVRRMVMAYDNEEKGNPNLPGYQEEERDRHDAQVWARVLARLFAKEGYEGRVAVLPDAWRDAKGKADWDGYLARRIASLNEAGEQEDDVPMGDSRQQADLVPAPGEQSLVIWQRVREKIFKEFWSVMETSVPVNEMWQAGFFDSREERIIKNRLEELCYEPRLPIGGNQEATIARRLFRLAARLKGNEDRLPGKARGFLIHLAQKYGDLKGGYYVFKPLKDATQAMWTGYLIRAHDAGDVEVKRACDLALKGLPERVSDFYMKAHYVLNRLNGTRCRIVTLHNIHGVNSGLLSLPSAPFSQPSKFREWLLDNITGATWRAGERELNDLQADIGRKVAFKDVAEVAVRGYHEDSKIWFFKDVAYTPDGEEIFAEKKNGIIWYKKDGQTTPYKLSEKDHEGQSFAHGEPRMWPERKCPDVEVTELFGDILLRLFETVGGYGAWLALGVILAYGAGPEIYGTFNGFPGLWLHGETQQGKSSVARWIQRIWGIVVKEGVVLKDSTKVGLSIVLQQYGNLPVFLEEFQPSAPEWMIEKIKNIFGRESGRKKTFNEEGDRKIVAGAIVTGIATSTDAQVKSRYAHVQVAKENRQGDHYRWFEDKSPDFFVLGRYLMRHRKAFAGRVVELMHDWMTMPEMQAINERSRIVHGAAFAAIQASMEMLKLPKQMNIPEGSVNLEGFRKFLVHHCVAAVKEVHDQVNVNQFWRDLLDALQSDAFGETQAERLRIFKVVENPRGNPDMSDKQREDGLEDSRKAWKSYLLYFQAGPAIDMLRRYKRTQGRDLPLDRSDLQAQMKVRPYWVKPKQDVHRQKFGTGSRTNVACWCIDLDKHELGYRKVSDEEMQESLIADQAKGTFLPSDEWVDPRRGDLFAIVDALIKKQEAFV